MATVLSKSVTGRRSYLLLKRGKTKSRIFFAPKRGRFSAAGSRSNIGTSPGRNFLGQKFRGGLKISGVGSGFRIPGSGFRGRFSSGRKPYQHRDEHRPELSGKKIFGVGSGFRIPDSGFRIPGSLLRTPFGHLLIFDFSSRLGTS